MSKRYRANHDTVPTQNGIVVGDSGPTSFPDLIHDQIRGPNGILFFFAEPACAEIIDDDFGAGFGKHDRVRFSEPGTSSSND